MRNYLCVYRSYLTGADTIVIAQGNSAKQALENGKKQLDCTRDYWQGYKARLF